MSGVINFTRIRVVAMRTVKAFRQDIMPVSNNNRDKRADRCWN